MAKAKSSKTKVQVKPPGLVRRRKHKPSRPNYCLYCTAKLPRDGRNFCNDAHLALSRGRA